MCCGVIGVVGGAFPPTIFLVLIAGFKPFVGRFSFSVTITAAIATTTSGGRVVNRGFAQLWR